MPGFAVQHLASAAVHFSSLRTYALHSNTRIAAQATECVPREGNAVRKLRMQRQRCAAVHQLAVRDDRQGKDILYQLNVQNGL